MINCILNEEHKGFAITLEVIATLAMLCAFMFCTTYFMKVMNVQRFMNTVLTSTASQASRWGGADSKPYKENVSGTESLTMIAKKQLDLIAPDFNAIIKVDNETVKENNKKEITLSIYYELPSIFESYGHVGTLNGDIDMYTKNLKMSITVNSIMEGGKLL